MIGAIVWVCSAAILPAAWFVVHFAGLVERPAPTAALAGASIFGAAFLLSWATEVAQLDIPRALALAVPGADRGASPSTRSTSTSRGGRGRTRPTRRIATANMTGAQPAADRRRLGGAGARVLVSRTGSAR